MGVLLAEKVQLHFPIHLIEGSYNPKTDTVKVRIITEGMGNRRDKHYYSAAVLQRAVSERVFEGAKAFADHPSKFDDVNLPERSVKDQVGYYYDVAMQTFRDQNAGTTVDGIGATFKIQEGSAQDWLRGLIRESITYNKRFPDKSYSGISINADGDAEPKTINGQDVKAVTHISEVVSADVVTMPARGGGFISLAESAHGASQRRIAMLKGVATVEKALRKIAESQTVEPTELLALAEQLKEAQKREAGGAKCAECGHMHEGEKCSAKDCECESFKKPAKEAKSEKDDDDEDDGETEAGKPSDKDDDEDDDDEDDDDEPSKTVEGGKKKESLTLADIKKKYPSFYQAALTEAAKHVGNELETLRTKVAGLSAEKALQESEALAKRKVIEAQLPAHMHDAVVINLIGLDEVEMDQVIAANVKFAEGFGWKKGKLVEGAGPRNNGSTQVSVRESDVTSLTRDLVAGVGEAGY